VQARASIARQHAFVPKLNQESYLETESVRERLRSLVCTAAIAAAAMPSGYTQSYPSKTIRLVVTFVPGGGSDSTARIIASGMSERLGQQVLVENQVGANTIVGTEYVANQRPDAYTMLVCTGSFVINPSLYKLHYDTLKKTSPRLSST